MTILLRCMAGFVVYVILGAVSLASVGGTILLWLIWYTKKTKFDSKFHPKALFNFFKK